MSNAILPVRKVLVKVGSTDKKLFVTEFCNGWLSSKHRKEIPDSDKMILEDKSGFRYQRHIRMEQELEVDYMMFYRI